MGADDLYFPEPTVPNVEWGRWVSSGDQVEWLDTSTLPRAKRIREFLNNTLRELGPSAGANLAHRFRRDPPFSRVYFEMIVGRFLQVMGGEVVHQPVGRGGVNVDWQATFPSGETVFVEATSPFYNQAAYRERRRREVLLAIIDEAAPPGWWIHPLRLPKLGLDEARSEFRGAVRSMLTSLPDRSAYSMDNRLRLEAQTKHGQLVLELWPGEPTEGAIAFVSMGAHVDDSSLRVARAVRDKRTQARAFPGQCVLIAVDAPFGGPGIEDYDQALLGSTVMHVSLEAGGPSSYSFRPDGALAIQRQAEFAGVLAFPQVGMYEVLDPIVYRHPRFAGTYPAEFLELRQRYLAANGIADVAATRSGIAQGIGFPSPGED